MNILDICIMHKLYRTQIRANLAMFVQIVGRHQNKQQIRLFVWITFRDRVVTTTQNRQNVRPQTDLPSLPFETARRPQSRWR